MHKPEILAPAGSMEAFKAAILNGADAVYLGGKLFNARQNAANFDDQELERAVKWAHSRQVKVYVTVNILLHNEELEAALHYLKFLYHIGVDGVIIQDLGLLLLAKEAIPELVLHGSTQMTIHNLQGAKYFADKGLDRIVLARELSFKDIATIRRNCDLELEVFVHGALCISYSGQCLMSSMIGGRSGNRGRCAQPCRLPYSLESASGKPIKAEGDYLLSPRDLATIDILPELVASGVHSLKFEGRMKRPEYVATVIRVYRNALDRCLADPDRYQATLEEKRQLAQIFNRDFTTGYYHHNPGGNLISYQRPNNRGILLGRISRINAKKRLAAVKLDLPLNVGDGIEYWVSKGGRTGITVKEIFLNGGKVNQAAPGSLVEIEAPPQAKPGDRIFKTHDAELMSLAKAGMDQEMEAPKIPVKMRVIGSVGEPLQLVVQDREGNEVKVLTDFLAEEAQKRPLTEEVLKKQLGRLGNTDYVLEELELDLPHNLMVPISELNALRRNAVAQLDGIRQKQKIVPFNGEGFNRVLASLNCKEKSRSLSTPKLAVSVGDPKSLEAAVSAGADYVYISGERFRSKRFDFGDYEEPVKEARKHGVQVYYGLPRLWLDSNEPALERTAKEIERLSVSGVVVSNPGGIRWARERFPGLPLVLDYFFNLMNDFSIRFVENEGVECITLSPELTFQEIEGLCVPSKLEFEGIVQGALSLMISEHCIVGGVVGCRTEKQPCSGPCKGNSFKLRDRKNYHFPLEMDQFCRMHIFNSQDLCLIEHLPRFRELGYHRVRIEARGQTGEYVKNATAIYRKALQELEYGLEINWEELRHLLAELSPHGLTKGHYFRGV